MLRPLRLRGKAAKSGTSWLGEVAVEPSSAMDRLKSTKLRRSGCEGRTRVRRSSLWLPSTEEDRRDGGCIPSGRLRFSSEAGRAAAALDGGMKLSLLLAPCSTADE